jgi:SAM-dependent methyltransferase
MFDRFRARMFNRGASQQSNHPENILSSLALKPGANVADYGSGGGYFALRFARLVGPQGKVYAIDINPAFLAFIRDTAASSGLDNIETVPVADIASRIPAISLDLIFCRDVYHHLSDRISLFMSLSSLLKPAGRVAIIDWLPDASRFLGPPPGHRTAPEAIIKEMEAAGLLVLERPDVLRRQSFTIFKL